MRLWYICIKQLVLNRYSVSSPLFIYVTQVLSTVLSGQKEKIRAAGCPGTKHGLWLDEKREEYFFISYQIFLFVIFLNQLVLFFFLFGLCTCLGLMQSVWRSQVVTNVFKNFFSFLFLSLTLIFFVSFGALLWLFFYSLFSEWLINTATAPMVWQLNFPWYSILYSHVQLQNCIFFKNKIRPWMIWCFVVLLVSCA